MPDTRFPVAALLCTMAASPASATGSIACTSPDEDGVSVELTIGNPPVLSVHDAYVVAGDDRWSMHLTGAEPVSVGQAFGEEDRLLIDLTDSDVERVVVEIRLFRAFEDRAAAMAGTLRIPGKGAWPLVCHGP